MSSKSQFRKYHVGADVCLAKSFPKKFTSATGYLPREMKFSSCGKFIVISSEYTQAANVIQVPAELLHYSNTPNEAVQQQVPQSYAPGASHISHRASTVLSSFNIKPGQAITTNTCIVRSGDNFNTQILEVQGGDTPSVLLSGNANGTVPQSLQLLSLPLITHVQHTVPTAIMPKSKDEPVKIIINSSSHDDYQTC